MAWQTGKPAHNKHTPEQRVAAFLAKVDREHASGCWVWLGSKNKQGYGNFWHAGKCWKAHRWAYSTFVGSLDPRKDILHRCDTPSCVRPNHLRQGTALDNCLDMWGKGRGKSSRGESNGNSRLTIHGVARIIDLHEMFGLEYAEIARRMQVNRTTVSRIINRQSWQGATHT